MKSIKERAAQGLDSYGLNIGAVPGKILAIQF